ncbi:CxC2 domain-containing protein [Mycena chlorophos]|uniref:CxC2 domain-containing protein n=1 Tax=Mycena chlorophos TaxID=658473 RepID=A0A8H6S7E5_MYCCL|nr:CxC2 domain-containing protein [Mycena chlorophos]
MIVVPPNRAKSFFARHAEAEDRPPDLEAQSRSPRGRFLRLSPSIASPSRPPSPLLSFDTLPDGQLDTGSPPLSSTLGALAKNAPRSPAAACTLPMMAYTTPVSRQASPSPRSRALSYPLVTLSQLGSPCRAAATTTADVEELEQENVGAKRKFPSSERARQFQRMSRQWAFLMRLKRAGRGHAPEGVDATPLGACAVPCWACPHEDRNLPKDWEKVDPRLQFLYMLILAVDANFRLKNRHRANAIHDPPLGPGWSYWVEPTGYNAHVEKYVSESDISTCIAFAALLQKDTRMTTGLRVSGVGACVCARHESLRPNGLGDLQKGERYCNMDWIVFSAIMGIMLLLLTISYDIACQWKIRLPERVARLPPPMQQPLKRSKVQFGLPDWHAESHNGDCKENNGMRYKSGVGKTEGEAIERFWAGLNPAAQATKEMGLGNRADTLDDRIDNHNFLKNMTLGTTLQRRLVVARDERARQIDAFQAVSDGVAADVQKEWKRMVREWQADDTKPNPYVLPTKGFPTEAEIRLQLQQEERQQSVDGRAAIAGSSATAFVSAGIQIEDMQARLRDSKEEHTLLTADRERKVEDTRGALLRKIARFRELQAIYMPGAAAVLAAAELARDGNAEPPLPEEIVLLMPDQMPRDAQGNIQGARTRSATSASSCTGSAGLLPTAMPNLTGQHQTTKAAKLLESVTRKTTFVECRYNRGYDALGRLGAHDKYPALHHLAHSDVRLPGHEDASDVDATRKLTLLNVRRGERLPRNAPRRPRRDEEESESRRVMSWIWNTAGAFDDQEQNLHDAMRVEWTRALARKNRWNEEVMLLEEEMRRVLRYLQWEVMWWREQRCAPSSRKTRLRMQPLKSARDSRRNDIEYGAYPASPSHVPSSVDAQESLRSDLQSADVDTPNPGSFGLPPQAPKKTSQIALAAEGKPSISEPSSKNSSSVATPTKTSEKATPSPLMRTLDHERPSGYGPGAVGNAVGRRPAMGQ